jgi:hypothetical protein
LSSRVHVLLVAMRVTGYKASMLNNEKLAATEKCWNCE